MCQNPCPLQAPHCQEPSKSLSEVESIAEAEGLRLLRNPSVRTGYLGVSTTEAHAHRSKPYAACKPGQMACHHLGNFATAHEAALAVARALGPTECRMRENQPRNRAGWKTSSVLELSRKEAMAKAKEEGLTLKRVRGRRGFWGVTPIQLATCVRWKVSLPCGSQYARESSVSSSGLEKDATKRITGLVKGRVSSSGSLYLGQYATAEGAALAIARHLRSDLKLSAHVESLQLPWKQEGKTQEVKKRVAANPDAAQECEAINMVEVLGEAVEVEAWSDDEADEDGAVFVEATIVDHGVGGESVASSSCDDDWAAKTVSGAKRCRNQE